MSKLTKEELEYHISDIGLDKALFLYNMTEKEADNLLFGKVYGESERFIYRDRMPEKKLPEIILTPDRIHLIRIIKKNYKVLYRSAVRDKWKVNGRANSQEDIFHNSLLAILKGNFVYKSDEETLHLLRHGYKNQSLGEVSAIKRTQEKTDQFKQLFREETSEQMEINESFLIENPLFLNDLNEKQRQIVGLIAAGNNSKEISEVVGIDLRSFSKHKKRIGVKINNFLKNAGSFA